jgi:hypothetical protein
MKLMTGYEFVDVPVEIELCPHCKQTRLMRLGSRMVCTKDGTKHDHGILIDVWRRKDLAGRT